MCGERVYFILEKGVGQLNSLLSGIPKHKKGPQGISVPGVSEGVAEKGRYGRPGNAQQRVGTVKPSPWGDQERRRRSLSLTSHWGSTSGRPGRVVHVLPVGEPATFLSPGPPLVNASPGHGSV